MLRQYCERHALPSLNLFLTLVEDSPDFIYTKDRQFRYLSINAAAAAAAGKTPREIIGRDDFELLPYEEAKAIRAVDAAMMEALPAAIFIAHDPQCRHMTGNRMVHEILQVPVGKNVSKSAPHHEAPQNFEAYAYGKKLAPD